MTIIVTPATGPDAGSAEHSQNNQHGEITTRAIALRKRRQGDKRNQPKVWRALVALAKRLPAAQQQVAWVQRSMAGIRQQVPSRVDRRRRLQSA